LFTTGQTKENVLATVISNLTALRSALARVQQENQWAAGVQVSDLVALGFTSADATVILGACADSDALAAYWNTGAPPAQYPQPASDYAFNTFAKQLLGP